MTQISWFIVPAILLTFLFVAVPAFLWLVDRIFRKPLGESLFKVQWKPLWIALAVICWIIDRVWVHYNQ